MSPYLEAEGPEQLTQLLDLALNQKAENQTASGRILYKIGKIEVSLCYSIQDSMIQFWYLDHVFQRPALFLKDVLLRFAWEKGGEKERYLATNHASNPEQDY